jgi:hypothetical protein
MRFVRQATMSFGRATGLAIRAMQRFCGERKLKQEYWSQIDKDFGELVIVQGKVHFGLIRLVGFRATDQGAAIVRLLTTYEAELAAGAIVTAEPWRVRIRPG